MDTYPDYDIIGPPTSLDALWTELKARRWDIPFAPPHKEGWLELSEEANHLVVRYAGPVAPLCHATFTKFPEKIVVGNIVGHPEELSTEQYAAVLDTLDGVVAPLAEAKGCMTSRSTSTLQLEDVYSPDTITALKHFTSSVNRDCPLAHPNDAEAWFNLIFSLHATVPAPSFNVAAHWLSKAGWSEKIVNELQCEAETNILLLSSYDKRIGRSS